MSGFDLTDLSRAEALQVWRRSVPTHEILDCDIRQDAPDADWASAWLLDRIILSPCAITSLHERRTAERILADGIDHYSVVVCETGSWTAWHRGTSFRASAGTAVVIDMGQPLELRIESSYAVQMIVPRAMLASHTTGRRLQGKMLDGAVGEVFMSMVRAIVPRLPLFTALDASSLCKVLCDLLDTALAPSEQIPETNPVELSLFERGRRAVLCNLANRELSPGMLAQILGLSRTGLYEAFRPFGGVAAFIQQTRLRAAHTLLLSGRGKGRVTVQQAATATGFVSAAHFSRLFRQHFGIRPSDLLVVEPADRQALVTPLPGESPWSTWIRRLGQ